MKLATAVCTVHPERPDQERRRCLKVDGNVSPIKPPRNLIFNANADQLYVASAANPTSCCVAYPACLPSNPSLFFMGTASRDPMFIVKSRCGTQKRTACASAGGSVSRFSLVQKFSLSPTCICRAEVVPSGLVTVEVIKPKIGEPTRLPLASGSEPGFVNCA